MKSRASCVNTYGKPATYAERLERSQQNRDALVHLVYHREDVVAVTKSYETAHRKVVDGGRDYRLEVVEVLP